MIEAVLNDSEFPSKGYFNEGLSNPTNVARVLEEAKEFEGIARTMEQSSGEMTKIDVHRARAECLDIEIELARLK